MALLRDTASESDFGLRSTGVQARFDDNNQGRRYA